MKGGFIFNRDKNEWTRYTHSRSKKKPEKLISAKAGLV